MNCLLILRRKFGSSFLNKATATARAAESSPADGGVWCFGVLPIVTQWALSVNFARQSGETSPTLLRFATALGSFTCVARRTQVQLILSSSSEGFNIQSSNFTRLEDEVQLWAWVKSGLDLWLRPCETVTDEGQSQNFWATSFQSMDLV